MSQHFVVKPGGPLRGAIPVPGDKSISHRALMLGALADGRTDISGFLAGADCMASLRALTEMGVQIEQRSTTELRVHGAGLRGLTPPAVALDMGNSGTAMRLFAGLLAGQSFDSTLVGDASLSRRPMNRVAVPLREMGAAIETDDGRAPLRIRGGQKLRGFHFDMPVASAQVKSALLLAGLYAKGPTAVREPAVTRDHTERMLGEFGVVVSRQDAVVSIAPPLGLRAQALRIPGDLSSAAFFLLAASACPGSKIQINNVGLNPTRTGVLEILKRMGADLQIEAGADEGLGEPAGNLLIRWAPLRGIDIPAELVPLAIDEFPVLFLVAALADGVTRITGAAELRHKESDRIGVMAAGLRQLGIKVTEKPDGAEITGGALTGGRVDSHGDHRVAMAFGMAAAVASGPVRIDDTANVDTSFPNFVASAQEIGLRITSAADD